MKRCLVRAKNVAMCATYEETYNVDTKTDAIVGDSFVVLQQKF